MRLLPFFLLLAVGTAAWSQEFTIYDNGLIYSKETVARLAHTVDSLNIRFKSCGPAPATWSAEQGRCVYVYLDSHAVQARDYILTNPPLDSFLGRFPWAKVERDLLAVRSKENEDGQTAMLYHTYPVQHRIRATGADEDNRFGSIGSWVFHFWSEKKYGSTLTLLWFETPPQRYRLPELYAQYGQYVDCMIDTSASVIFPEAAWEKALSFTEQRALSPALDSFARFIRMPKRLKSKKQPWQNTRLQRAWVADHLASLPAFKPLLQAAVDEAIRLRSSDEDLEYYAGAYLGAEAQLRLMRCRRVMGYCSQDSRPRDHAFNIAVLAAETHSWDIFLRAHLDIMNDNFSRMSDGSYAWAHRGTYLHELEVLGFDVPELLLGVCLQTGNAPTGRYQGYVGRIGRALAESQDYAALSQKIEQAIADPNLDDFNRLIMWYLYGNMMHYRLQTEQPELDRDSLRQRAAQLLTPVRQQLPDYLAQRI